MYMVVIQTIGRQCFNGKTRGLKKDNDEVLTPEIIFFQLPIALPPFLTNPCDFQKKTWSNFDVCTFCNISINLHCPCSLAWGGYPN